ncbi:methyl-accepting chemotaxis protein [Luteimonas notoginsengisoli]|uniref:Methyl-accepting chemotaxis protein n=1 Tax=Luteimonas notoginsengisoli TaxID=1578200 RepID=A0ABV7UP04_9GAMM
MRWFNDLSITRKMLAGISLAALLTLTLGTFAYVRLVTANGEMTDIAKSNVPQVQALGDIRSFLGELRTYELALVDTQNFAEYEPRFAKMVAAIGEADAQYAAHLSAGTDKRLYAESDTAVKAYLAASARLLDAARRGDFDAAGNISSEESRPARRTAFAALDALGADDRARLAANLARSDATFDRSVVIMIVLTIGSIILSLLGGFFIARAVGRALGRATAISAALADGRFDNAIEVDSKDEAGQLMASMQQVQAQLQRFHVEMKSLIELQQSGENLQHRMPEDFPGDYGNMAKGVNAAIFGHLDAIVAAIEIMSEYGRGDLHRDAPRLPGQRAVLHEALDSVKASLGAVNGDIRGLAEAAARGDFRARGDEARYEHAFREMVAALNRLMAEADAGLSDVGRIMASIAEGDLSQRVERQYQGAFGRLAADTNRTVEHLTDIVGQIRGGSDAINVASGEIAAGNQDLSQRTEQQAASLEETASSMEELTSTVRQTADNARQANQLAIGAAQVAEQGGAVVGQVVNTMSAINESSRRISDIIGVIDGIAFQTNILALNAAVEAARAGEQGRGFAVVATEVRSLAQRSANAAKEIKQLITESVDKVEHGNALVEEAGKTMGEIVTSVKRVTDIIADISAASQEQSTGIEQVNQAITQMDEGTQQNAALVEEATAAARSLEEQAGQLVQAVATFRLDRTQAAAVAAAPRKPAAPAAGRPADRAPTPRPAAQLVRESATLRVAANGDDNWHEF